MAMEDESPAFSSTSGTFENALPDFIARLRFQRERMHLQLAGFATQASFVPTIGLDSNDTAWGVSLSGSLKVFESDKVMGQFSQGDGIQRFRGFQSYTLDAGGALFAVPEQAWYVGYEHVWSKKFKSVFAFSNAELDFPGPPTALKSTDYLAANILWTPIERVRLGLEYLYGNRVDQDASSGDANRLQFAAWFYLP